MESGFTPDELTGAQASRLLRFATGTVALQSIAFD